jgi:hypothetical protein
MKYDNEAAACEKVTAQNPPTTSTLCTVQQSLVIPSGKPARCHNFSVAASFASNLK